MLVLARAVYFLVALPLVVAALDRFLNDEYAEAEDADESTDENQGEEPDAESAVPASQAGEK